MKLVDQPMPIWWAIMAGMELQSARHWLIIARQDKKNQFSPKQAVGYSRMAHRNYCKCAKNAMKAMESLT